jgi:copper chaperone CopZ
MKFKVEKMMCGGCTSNVQSSLEALENVTSVDVDLESGTAIVNGEVDPQVVIATLIEAGYPTELIEA